jgi:hypothetical protein
MSELDEIRSILRDMALRQQQLQVDREQFHADLQRMREQAEIDREQFQANSNQFQADLQQMREQSQIDRERFQVELQQTRQIVDSNARAIEVNSNAIMEMRATLQASTDDLVQMLTQFATEAAEDRTLIRQEMQGIRSELREIGLLVREIYGGSHNGNPPAN